MNHLPLQHIRKSVAVKNLLFTFSRLARHDGAPFS
jgi:hypothetical protein